MIPAILIMILGLGACAYIIITTIIELRKLNKKRSKELEEIIILLTALKQLEKNKDYKRALDYAIKELEK